MIEERLKSTALAPMPLRSHDTGVSPTRSRRRFTATYKLQILEAVAQCTQPGALGAPRRGPKPTAPDTRAKRIVKRIAKLERQLKRTSPRCNVLDPSVRSQQKRAFVLLGGLVQAFRD